MTGRGDVRIAPGTAMGDVLFRITTSPMRPQAIWPAGSVLYLDHWIQGGGRVRSAGPKWFAVWGADTPRMRRLKRLVLPAPWICHADEEMTAILFAQLRKIDPTLPETPLFADALARVRSRLRLEASRGD